MFRNQYDNDVTVWSPQGRIHQIEYAMEAVKQGSATVGLKSKTHAVIVALKRAASELSAHQKKILPIDDHVAVSIAGLTADARLLSKFMRSECLLSKYVYDRQLPVSRLVSAVGDKMQIPTQRYGRRPYGVGLLVAGYDDMGPHIYQTCPSANYFDCKAMAIGARSQSARTYLERHLDEFPDCEPEELIKHGLRALRETLPSEQELTTKNCSVGVVGKGQDLVIYSDEAVAPHLAGIDQTKRRMEGQADDVAMEDESETIATMIPKITVVSNTKGWDIVMNEQLIKALARDERVEVSGFVPGHTKKQRDQAQRMNILLYDAKPYSGFDTNELLSYPPDDLKIDILIMHSYGRDVGKQAQDIRNRKGCKWVLVVHTFRKDLEKYLEMVPARSAEFQESEHQLQVDLCEKADLVLAVGHKVAKAYEAEMRTPLRTFIPSIPREFLDTQQRVRSSPFKVLLSASKKYFEVKGCDIAAKAFSRLEDPSIHLLLVVKEGDSTSEIKEAMVEKGISRNQLEVRRLFEGDQEKAWQDLLGEVDLLIKPSKSEGFGMAGLRAIAANLPVLISGNCGLAIALRELPSGNKHVVHSQDPTVWARRIQEIKEKDGQICRSEVEQLKNEYSAAYNLEDQVNSLIDEFSKMVKSDIQHGVKETL